MFGLFAICGYQFSPRIADIGDARLWRTHATAGYGPLQEASRHTIHKDRVRAHRGDMLCVAGSLTTGEAPNSRESWQYKQTRSCPCPDPSSQPLTRRNLLVRAGRGRYCPPDHSYRSEARSCTYAPFAVLPCSPCWRPPSR
ncbi:Tn3 family transposase [Streptomyces sp. NPDC056891]|uniref:Tn3 family transposase n=1 Tax=unclassified Streptomyces TaxID=2593676 RepID=UPI00368A385B